MLYRESNAQGKMFFKICTVCCFVLFKDSWISRKKIGI